MTALIPSQKLTANQAIANFRQALKIRGDDFWCWYRQADCFLRWGHYAEAIKCYQKSVEIRPRDYWAWFRQGELWQKLYRYPAAIACYHRALDVEVDDDYAWYEIAICHVLQKNYEDGVYALGKVLEWYPQTYAKLIEGESIFDCLHCLSSYQALINMAHQNNDGN